jgi:hypothetical protein
MSFHVLYEHPWLVIIVHLSFHPLQGRGNQWELDV